MLKVRKEQVVAELTEQLRTADSLIVADYRGLTMKEIDGLRGKLIESGARFAVVKNTLGRRAAQAVGNEPLLELLQGPTAIAFVAPGGDPVAAAKALADAARETRILTVRGGMLQGAAISAEDVASLATLPPVDVLRGQVLGAISAPLYAIVGLVTAPLRDLIGLIDARIEQLGGAPETTEETPAEEPAAEAPETRETAAAAESAAEDTTSEETNEDGADVPADEPKED